MMRHKMSVLFCLSKLFEIEFCLFSVSSQQNFIYFLFCHSLQQKKSDFSVYSYKWFQMEFCMFSVSSKQAKHELGVCFILFRISRNNFLTKNGNPILYIVWFIKLGAKTFIQNSKHVYRITTSDKELTLKHKKTDRIPYKLCTYCTQLAAFYKDDMSSGALTSIHVQCFVFLAVMLLWLKSFDKA